MKLRVLTFFKNIVSATLVFFSIIVAIFCLAGICFNFVYTVAPVKNYCMYPLINQYAPDENTYSDYAYLNKFAEYKANDIVIATPNWPLTEGSIIKRLVGTPGDTIEILETENNYQLLINNNLLYEKEKTYTNVHGGTGGSIEYYNKYLLLLEKLPEQNLSVSTNNNVCIKLNSNEYFLMGDNWGESYDSIENGIVKKHQIDGRVDFIIAVNQNKHIELIKQFCKALFTI